MLFAIKNDNIVGVHFIIVRQLIHSLLGFRVINQSAIQKMSNFVDYNFEISKHGLGPYEAEGGQKIRKET